MSPPRVPGDLSGRTAKQRSPPSTARGRWRARTTLEALALEQSGASPLQPHPASSVTMFSRCFAQRSTEAGELVPYHSGGCGCCTEPRPRGAPMPGPRRARARPLRKVLRLHLGQSGPLALRSLSALRCLQSFLQSLPTALGDVLQVRVMLLHQREPGKTAARFQNQHPSQGRLCPCACLAHLSVHHAQTHPYWQSQSAL